MKSLIDTMRLKVELFLLRVMNLSIFLDATACYFSPLKYLTPCFLLSLHLSKKHLNVGRSFSIFNVDIDGKSHLVRVTNYERVLFKPNIFIHRMRVSVSGRAFMVES
jgi:hypothetical protein